MTYFGEARVHIFSPGMIPDRKVKNTTIPVRRKESESRVATLYKIPRLSNSKITSHGRKRKESVTSAWGEKMAAQKIVSECSQMLDLVDFNYCSYVKRTKRNCI